MSKQTKKPKVVEKALDAKQREKAIETNDGINAEPQVVENSQEITKNAENTTAFPEKELILENAEKQEKAKAIKENPKPMEKSDKREVGSNNSVNNLNKEQKQKSGGSGKGIAIIALLVALAIGGAGHFFANKKFGEVEAQIANLKQQLGEASASVSSVSSTQVAQQLPSFESEKAQLAKLTEDYQKALNKIAQLETEQSAYSRQIGSLQNQVQKLGSTPQAEPTVWLLSDADFLLNNARRKMVLDNDIDATRSLLIEANNVLSQLADPKMLEVREAIKADLEQLASLNKVDQNNVMQRLGQLANLVDDMPMLDNETISSTAMGEVSDSLADWQQNLEKSANSFLSHFIRISDKGKTVEKAFVAPNQEIYLRENIRLRLQIAILAVPRQQNELYKQSLEAVSTWVRSYFDVQNGNVKNFLAEVDDLIEQSIYIDAPTELKSLTLLEKALNKRAKPMAKIEIEADKALEVEQPKNNAQPASNGQ